MKRERNKNMQIEDKRRWLFLTSSLTTILASLYPNCPIIKVFTSFIRV